MEINVEGKEQISRQQMINRNHLRIEHHFQKRACLKFLRHVWFNLREPFTAESKENLLCFIDIGERQYCEVTLIMK